MMAARKRRAGEFTTANRSVGKSRAGLDDAQAAGQGAGNFGCSTHASAARDADPGGAATRSVLWHLCLTRDFIPLGAIGPGVALLFCRMPCAVSGECKARGECIVAILKERIVHGHGRESRSSAPAYSSANGAARRPEPIPHRANSIRHGRGILEARC